MSSVTLVERWSSFGTLQERWTASWNAACASLDTATATGALSASDAGTHRNALQAERKAVEDALSTLGLPGSSSR